MIVEVELPKTAAFDSKMFWPIETLALSLSARLYAEALGARYVGDLCNCSAEKLMSMRGFGKQRLAEVVEVLEDNGLSLGGVPYWPPPNLDHLSMQYREHY